jgi:Pyridoxamine 5'-phosphate oxidase
MPIERSRRPVSSARIAVTARRLLDASTLCAIATVSPRGSAHINTAYFAWTEAFEIVWLSDPAAAHSRNLETEPSAAVSVFDSNQVWGEPDRGIQVFGTAREVGPRPGSAVPDVYSRRFPAYPGEELGGYRFYVLRPRRIKLFDERELGPGVFVTATVGRGGRLAWQRTEIYRTQITSS